MSKDVIQKLIDKGFNGADIHYFLSSFDIGIDIYLPCARIIYIDANDSLQERELKIALANKQEEARYQEWKEERLSRWEIASIAADFEKHK